MSDTLLRLPHIASRLFNCPLAIEQSKLHVLASVIAPRLGVVLTGLPGVSPFPQVEARSTPRSESDAAPLYGIHNDVAVIPVFGTLVQRSGWMDAESGLTSYEQLRAAVEAADDDPAITSKLLHIDSGGGEAMGLADFVAFLSDSGQRKPITTFTDGMAASAAYDIFSAGSTRLASQDAVLGSIGVRMLHVDQSARDEAQGLVVTEFHAGARKLDLSPHQSLNKDKRAALQAIVDTYYEMFTARVADHLGMSQAEIKATEAGLYVGQQSVDAGLAQQLSTLDRALETAPARITHQRRRTSMSTPVLTTVAALEAAYPDIVAALRSEASSAATHAEQARLTDAHATALTAAVTTERARIQKIFSLAPVGCDALRDACAFTAPCSTAEAAEQFLTHQKTLGPARLTQLRADAPEPVAPLAAPLEGTAGAKTESEKLMEQAALDYNKSQEKSRLGLVQGGRS